MFELIKSIKDFIRSQYTFQEFIGSYSDNNAIQLGPFEGKAPEGLAPNQPYIVMNTKSGDMQQFFFPTDGSPDFVTEMPVFTFDLFDVVPDRLWKNADTFRNKMDRFRPNPRDGYCSICQRNKSEPLTIISFQETGRRMSKISYSYIVKYNHAR